MITRQVREIMKSPAFSSALEEEFVETYYPLSGLNKYIIIYNKKDNVVTRTWKEY